ncbi:MAG: hypothetical protein Kow0029_18340 [Candidatus Rifleibacteriota bacterium]
MNTYFKKVLGLSCLFALVVCSVDAHPADNVSKALKLLKDGKLDQAEKEMQIARFADPTNPIVKYNLGYINYRKRNYADAMANFSDSAEKAKDDELKFKSFHNLGNAAYRMREYALAVDAYKRALAIKHKDETEFNLKKAEEMLKKQLERMQQQQKNPENQKEGKDQQNQQNQQNSQNDQKNGQQNNQNNQNQQGNQQNRDSSQNGQNQKSGQAKSSDKDQNEQGEKNQQSEQNAQNDDKINKQKQENNAQSSDKDEEERQDVQMAQQNKDEKRKPEASQRARALKNVKINPYMVEKLMREMKERERQAQLYYRNDAQRQEELDPFEMDARQLHEFFQNRGRKSQPKSDEPDW